MEDLGRTFITLGGIFFLGLGADSVGRHTRIPRVTLLLVVGVALGPLGCDQLPAAEGEWFPLISHTALAMVGFLLGGSFELAEVRRHGRAVLGFAMGEVTTTALVVSVGCLLVGQPLAVALVLGGIATATDPAATTEVVREARASGRFAKTLLGIVALDDALGLLAFSLLLAVAQSLDGGGGLEILWFHSQEVVGGILLGAGLGIPMALLTGRVDPGEPTLAEALGGVLLCSGLALWLHVSFLLACMALGAVVTNRARHHRRPFHAIEGIEWPFMTLFFVLAGASLRFESLITLGALVPTYFVLRGLGRLVGGWVSRPFVGWELDRCGWMGLALMPQAGVALGMALVAAERLPELAHVALPVAIASTVAFELLGPSLTRIALERSGEVEAP